MAELGDDGVQLFAQPRKKSSKRKHVADKSAAAPKSKHSKKDPDSSLQQQQQQQEQEQKQDPHVPELNSKQPDASEIADASFHDLGVSDWLCAVLHAVGELQFSCCAGTMKCPSACLGFCKAYQPENHHCYTCDVHRH